MDDVEIPDESEKDQKKEELKDLQKLEEIKEKPEDPIPVDYSKFFDFKKGNASHLTIAAPTRGGKSEMINGLIQKYLPCFETVVIMCGTFPFSKSYDDLVKRHSKKIKIYPYSNEFLMKFINVSKQRSLQNKTIYTLLVLDDITNIVNNKTQAELGKFLTLCRHQGINVFLCSHQANNVLTPLLRDNIQYFLFRQNSINSLKTIYESVITADSGVDFLTFQNTVKHQDRDYWFCCYRKCGDQLDGLYKMKLDRSKQDIQKEQREKEIEIKKNIEDKKLGNRNLNLDLELKNNIEEKRDLPIHQFTNITNITKTPTERDNIFHKITHHFNPSSKCLY